MLREPLKYDVVHAAAQSVIDLGREKGLNLAVSIVNRSGITKVVLSDDGAGPIAVETGRRKAYTAAVTGMLTAIFVAFAASPTMAAAPPHLVDTQFLPAPDGVPIVVDGEVIGGLGVGGADSDTDADVAQQAVERFSSQW